MLLFNILMKQDFVSSGTLEKFFQSLGSMIMHFGTCVTFIKNVLTSNLNEYILLT